MLDLNLFDNKKINNDFQNKNNDLIKLKNILKDMIDEGKNMNRKKDRVEGHNLNKENNVLEEYNLYEKKMENMFKI